jgi:hypothetical protein
MAFFGFFIFLISLIFYYPILGVIYLFELAIYVWFALCLHMIARKTGMPHPWLAWIPFANFYLMFKIAGKPLWWTVSFCIIAVLSILGIISPPGIYYGWANNNIPLWILPLVITFPVAGVGAYLGLWLDQYAGPAFFTFSAISVAIGIFFWVLFVMAWMAIAKVRGRPSWLGILTILPIANQVIKGMFAFSDKR